MLKHFEMLDNPVWQALQTIHQSFAQGTAQVQRYPVGVLQFMGCADPATADINELLPWTTIGEKLIIIGELPVLPDNWALVRQLDCIQMTCEETSPVDENETVIALDEKDIPDMLALTGLVQPGFFFEGTPLLGQYYGLRQEGQLVAVAGERIKVTGMVEVSAVCTHPSFTGRGYAQQLVTHIMATNIAKGNVLYLHFVNTNDRARKVYELLGFKYRRPIVFWEVIRNS